MRDNCKYIISTILVIVIAFSLPATGQTELFSITPALGSPNGLELTSNELWISDASGVTEKYTTGGSPLGVTVTAAVNAISANSSGELHVVATDSVRTFESNGNAMGAYDITGIDVQHTGNFYYVLDGSTVGMYAPGGVNIGGGGSFSNAVSIHFGLYNGLFVFADNGADEVVVMDGGLGSVLATIPVVDPNGAAFLSDGRVVVAHSDSISFYQDDGQGYYLAQTSTMGGSLSMPSKMEVNLSDEIYLLDEGTGTIMVIEPPQAVLPITLSKFEARLVDTRTILMWRSEAEINASGFEIQHSLDGRDFQALGFVEAEGSGSSYQFSHAPSAGANYYRLRQIDLDGFEEFSKVVLVVVESSKEGKVYPNPSAGFVTVSQPATIYTMVGVEVARTITENQMTELPQGNYVVRFKSGATQKLFIQ